MTLVRLTDPDVIAAFYRPNLAAHLYEVGDLDDAFRSRTDYWALVDGAGAVQQAALLYTASPELTILVATTEAGWRGLMRELLTALAPALPDRVYMHVNADVAPVLMTDGGYGAEPHGTHLKMALTDPDRAWTAAETADTLRLGPEDAGEVSGLYAAAYSGGWFDPALLGTGLYFGARSRENGGPLLSVAGVHVASDRWGVAAIGNVATRPEARGRGLARAVCAALCRDLIGRGVRHVGLNVRTDNAAAVACYRGLGFAPVAEYEEIMLTRPAS